MKQVKDVKACVVDYGTFISVAEKLAETMDVVYYYSPYETEYQDIRNCIKGTGLERVVRCNGPLNPRILPEIDLFVFPDIGYGSLQQHLRSRGKAVWGHMGADELELQRDLFLDTLDQVGLPIAKHKRIIGLSRLADYLETTTNKWVKISQYRSNMDTWHHINLAQSIRTLDSLRVILGGMADFVTFIVMDDLKTDIEVGYDGWCIDGKFPNHSFQGYEKKNELYLGSFMANEDLPEAVLEVNEKMSGVLEDYGYRDWWATEIRVKDDTPYFIDPTPRMPGQTGEHQLETIANFSEIIWAGANGIVVQPRSLWDFAAEATLHFKGNLKDPTVTDEWKVLELPKATLPWLKLYHYCVIDSEYHFPVRNSDEVGVVIGVGDNILDAIEHLRDNLETLKDLPVSADVEGFDELLKKIKKAERKGITFGL